MTNSKPTLRRRATQPTPKPRPIKPAPLSERAIPEEIALKRSKGAPGKGGGTGGESWQIEWMGKRAGSIFINLIDDPHLGPHASIQIHLNRAIQGKGVGRIAYKRACEESQYALIYAHMSKKNIASRRAAEAAGFLEVSCEGESQLLMCWRKP